MTPRLLPLTLLLLAACAAPRAMTEPRGETRDTVYLLIRSDDAGMTHAVNMAIRRLIETGMPVSVSVMTVTPWWQESADLLRQYPAVSVGIHLALNSEWRNYRWGPPVGASGAPTLVDEHGFFFHSSRDVYENEPDLGEVERELREQIDRALRAALQVDYVDFHMGTVRNHPGFLGIANRLAAEYGLLVSGAQGEVFWDPQYRAEPSHKPDSLAAMVERLESRLNVLITHPGLDTPELAALVDMNVSNPLESMAAHRKGELDALLSAEFARALRRSPVKLITYRDLAAMVTGEPISRAVLGPGSELAAAASR